MADYSARVSRSVVSCPTGQGTLVLSGCFMRSFLSLSGLILASSVAVAAPAHKEAATHTATFASRQTTTEKQATGVYDLSALPVFTGSVVQFLPAPHGGIVGFVLNDGTQVFVSPEQAHTFAGLVKVGDKVEIRGIKGQVLPIIRAFSVASPRGRTVQDSFIEMPLHSPEMITGPDLVLHGEVWMPLYDVGGHLSGAVLKDHSVIYLSPREAGRVASLLQTGQTVYAVGSGSSGELGVAIDAREIGPAADKLVSIAVGNAPPPGPAAGSPGYDVIPGADEH